MASDDKVKPSTSYADNEPSATEDDALRIVEPLEDITVRENAKAVFECKISGWPGLTVIWCKDGLPIEPNDRIKCLINDNKCILEISPVKENDHGVYTVYIKKENIIISSMASLFVGFVRNSFIQNGVLYVGPHPQMSSNIIRHLKKVAVKVGDKIRLEVECHSDVVNSYFWFKNNQAIRSDDRIKISETKKISNLYIKNATLTDTGIYLVVARTQSDVVSSYIDVHVTEMGPNILPDRNNIIPNIIEDLPEELQVGRKEKLTMMCAASHDLNTEIEWYETNKRIEKYELYNPVDFGYHCIGLRCLVVNTRFIMPYKVVLRANGREVSSLCQVSVFSVPATERPSVVIKKPLESAIACFGARVIFQCSFILDDPKCFYVVWCVGHYTVERSNTRFEVICNNGDFLLIIKQLEPCMPGEVVCELRKGLPNQTSTLLTSTSAFLTVVPPSFLEEEFNTNTKAKENLDQDIIIYKNSVIKARRNVLDRTKRVDSDCTTIDKSHILNEVVMEIDYSRLPEEEIYHVDMLNEPNDNVSVVVYEHIKDLDGNQQKVIVFELKKMFDSNFWYGVELAQPNGEFINVGVSSTPKFELVEPPVGEILRVRIRALEAREDSCTLIACINPPTEHLSKIDKQYELKTIEQLHEIFTITEDVIGCGTFGKVILLKNKQNAHFAAKILKTKTQKKRKNALKEYELMKGLNHTKLVQLIAAFREEDQMVFVMEYFWGGELFDRIVEEECIKEIDVVLYVRQICEGLAYLHNKGIVHLDLKPENIVCLSPNSRQIKLIDFGLAKVVSDGEIPTSMYGTKDYIAPEVLNFEYATTASDMWSLGVVTYVMLSGIMPFGGDAWITKLSNIVKINYNYNYNVFNEISDAAKDFIDSLLIRREDRMTASTALQHRWLERGPSKRGSVHLKQARENLKSYLADYRSKWQRVGNAMIALNRLQSQASRSVLGAIKQPSKIYA